MTNLIQSTTKMALHMVSAYAKAGATVIDATCGNGHDSLALLKMKPAPACLYAFDIQAQAIEATRALIAEHLDTVYPNTVQPDSLITCTLASAETEITLIHDSHENMDAYVSVADIVLFNLGYLPGAGKSLTTTAASTMRAVTKALEMLNKGGLLCITMYSGHEAGAIEKAEILDFARKLDPRIYHVAYINIANQPNNPPESLLVTRK